MIAVGGFKVFPSQVEAVLEAASGGQGSAGDRGARCLWAKCRAPIVTLQDGAGETGDALRDWLNPALASTNGSMPWWCARACPRR
jgi:long-chain acyl-CoA synthetase